MNYEAVLAGLPDAVIAVDADLRIVFWNSAAEVLTERSARRAEGRYIKEIFSPDASVVRRLGKPSPRERAAPRPRPSWSVARAAACPCRSSRHRSAAATEQVEAAVVVLRDLSRIRQLEAEVRRGETLAAAGRMAVGLAHEVRNPLGAIRGAVQLLQRELGGDSRLGEYTDVLLTEVDRVNRIIEMLLDLARPVQLRAVPLNLHQLLERVTLLNEEGARERGVALDPALRPESAADPRRRGPAHCRSSTTSCATPWTRWTSGGRLTLTTRVSLNPLFGKIDVGTGQRSMVEVAGGRRGRRHPRRRPRRASSIRSSRPRTRASASGSRSATASSRSTAAPSRWTARKGAARS